jgi:hypothetical protein
MGDNITERVLVSLEMFRSDRKSFKHFIELFRKLYE